ncbi:hypothetical protein [Halopseudomonas sp.]|uniref:hypothetical protein n=1 Tax=Halopseudomonas sp. TaxID=2901191 RepID=UPI003001DF6E
MEILAYVGIGIIFIGGLGFLIAAFKESILWGIGCILLSPVSIVFLVLHWEEAKNPFLLQLVGIGLLLVSTVLGGGADF